LLDLIIICMAFFHVPVPFAGQALKARDE
jgi:hypothetical protein